MKTPDDPGQRAVQSIEVGGRLLLALSRSRQPMALKDLAAAAGLPSARAHPYLVSFCKLEFVVQDSVTGRYQLGPEALQIGLTCLHQLDLQQLAEQLAGSTGYAVALAIWGNFGPTIVRMIEARQPLLVAMRAGTVMSVLGTATGRAFAGMLSADRILGALSGPLGEDQKPALRAALTPAETLIHQQAIADLATHGVVRSQGRPIPSVNAFSAPVVDHEGTTVMVITALGHQDDFPTEWDSMPALAVRQAAQELSRRLGAG